MTGLDFDALCRGESPGEGIPAMATPPWDTKAPKENGYRVTGATAIRRVNGIAELARTR
jgi:hypothetical protein